MNTITWLVRRFKTAILPVLLSVICVLPAWSANTCSNFIADGSFSNSNSPNFTAWTQFSSSNGTPLCDIPTCKPTDISFAPRSQSWWAWFGPGIFPPEIATLGQSIVIPVGVSQLQFYLWNKSPLGTVADILDVRMDIDPVPIFSTVATDTAYNAGYTLVTLDLSQYADGSVHQLLFESQIDIDANFHLDDISRAPNEIFVNYDPVAKKILHKSDLLQPVIDASLPNQEIRGQVFTGNEDITVNLSNPAWVLNLRGGYDCDLANNTSGFMTAVRSLTLTAGNVNAENIVTRTPVGAIFPALSIKSGKFVAKNVILRRI